MTRSIVQFQGAYRFLSNFYREPCGTTNEHRFQAEKTLDLLEKHRILGLETPGDAKRAGREVPLREDWDRVKDSAMDQTLRIKFSDPGLRDQLLGTGDAELIEGNSWNDTYWGVNLDTGVGQNKLGMALMKLRKEFGGAGSARVEESK